VTLQIEQLHLTLLSVIWTWDNMDSLRVDLWQLSPKNDSWIHPVLCHANDLIDHLNPVSIADHQLSTLKEPNFWNNPHRVCSKSKVWKPKYFLWARKRKWLQKRPNMLRLSMPDMPEIENCATTCSMTFIESQRVIIFYKRNHHIW
jgi:hypothetical protein